MRNTNSFQLKTRCRSFYTRSVLGVAGLLAFLPPLLMAQSAQSSKASSSVFVPISAPTAHYATMQEAFAAGKQAVQEQRWADATTAFLAAETMTSNPQAQALLAKWVEYVEAKRGTAAPVPAEAGAPGASNSVPAVVSPKSAVDVSKIKTPPVSPGAYHPGNFGGQGVWVLHGGVGEYLVNPIMVLESFNPGFGGGTGYFAPIGSHFKLGPDLDYLTYSNTRTQATTVSTGFPPVVQKVSTTLSMTESDWQVSLDGQVDLSAPHSDYSYLLMGLGAAFQSFSGNGATVSATSPLVRLGAGGNFIEQKGFCAFIEVRFNLIFLSQSSSDSLSVSSGMILEVPVNVGIGVD